MAMQLMMITSKDSAAAVEELITALLIAGIDQEKSSGWLCNQEGIDFGVEERGVDVLRWSEAQQAFGILDDLKSKEGFVAEPITALWS